jgi:probable addiction module antidote protein
MRIDAGPGYRVYYALAEKQVVLLCVLETRPLSTRISKPRSGAGKIGKRGNQMATKRRDNHSHDEVVADLLRADPEFRVAMINEVMSDGDYADMLILLRQLTLAEGGMKVIAERTGLSETALCRLMSAEGNPSLKNLAKVLDSLNLQLAVAPKRETAAA